MQKEKLIKNIETIGYTLASICCFCVNHKEEIIKLIDEIRSHNETTKQIENK